MMLYCHVLDKISNKFCGTLRVFVNFADLLEFYSSVTTYNIRSSVNNKFLKNIQCECLQYFMVIRI